MSPSKLILPLALFTIPLFSGCDSPSKEVSVPADAPATPEEVTEPAPLVDALKDRLRDAYNVDQFESIDRLSWCFLVERDDEIVASRAWHWDRRQDTVRRESLTDSDELQIAEISLHDDAQDQEIFQEVHRQFINDQYWLTFPRRALTDSGISYSADESVPIPGTELEAPMLAIQYQGDDGYTPGDRYELFLDDDGFIIAWNFISGANPDEPRTMLYDQRQSLGPLIHTEEHFTPDHTFGVLLKGTTVEVDTEIFGFHTASAPDTTDVQTFQARCELPTAD